MDRRDWLWRKRSLEKIPGETDSSGSVSSHSERFSDEQANSTHNAPSPEVTSKTALNDDENENVKSLNQKLSTALLNLNAKEGLLKQHEKVAEEAVAGWEKADREVSNLKLQLDATRKKNSALEDRVGHLGEALKECMWQLRESKEEKDRQIEEEIVKRSLEWESTKSDLENQLSELHTQLETAKSEPVSTINGLRVKLEAAENENASLRLELIEISKNLDARTVERDLSTQAAENASKQHLESIKKVAKLEAECRVLKLTTRKASMGNDHKTFVHEASNSPVSALMEDFHDMERLAALSETKTQPDEPLDKAKIENLEAERLDLKRALSEAQGRHKASQGQLNATKTELIKLRHQLFECQDQLKASQAKLTEKETELKELRARLVDLEDQLKRSQGQVKETVSLLMEMRAQLAEYQAKLKASQEHTEEVETRLVELENELAMANERKEVLEGELEASNGRRGEAELQVNVLESEVKSLHVTVDSLLEVEAKCQRLENELSKRKIEPQIQCSWHNNMDMKAEQEKELAVAASKLADCQKTIASLGRQLESLATLDEILAESDNNSVDSCGESPIFRRTGELRRLASIDCK